MSSAAHSASLSLNIPARIERLPLTRVTWQVVLLAGLAWFIESLDIGALGVALTPIKQVFQLSSSNVGFLTAASTFGIVVGLIPAGLLSDRFGRKRMLVWGIVEYSIMTLVCAFSVNFPMLLIFRFLSGLGMGAVFPLPYAIVSEFVKSRQRTTFNGMMDAFLSIGYFIAPLLGLLILPKFAPAMGWRVFFAVAAVPLLYAFIIHRYMPESPRWLERHGFQGEAEAVLAKMEDSVQSITGRALPVPEPQESVAPVQGKKASIGVPWSRPLIKRTVSRSFAAIGTFFMFYIVMTYMPSIFTSSGFSFAHSLLFTAIITGAAIPGKLLNGYFAERFGRKSMYVVFMGIAGIATLFFGLAKSPASMVTYACLMSFFGTGAFPALKMSYAEQYPTYARATGAATVETMGRFFGGVVGSYVMPVILGTSGLATGTYVIAAAVLVALIFELTLSPESKGSTLEELEMAIVSGK